MRIIYIFALIFVLGISPVFSQEYSGAQADARFKDASMLRMKPNSTIPDYVKLQASGQFEYPGLTDWMQARFHISDKLGIRLLKTENDKKMDMVHYRLRQSYQGVDVWDANFIVHSKAGKVEAINGKMYPEITSTNTASLSEQQALESALKCMNAEHYKWQSPGMEQLIKHNTGNPNATYYPKGQLVLLPAANNTHRYTFMFNIYADKPLKRSEVFVDAQNGDILQENDKIYESDTVGSAVTKYLGLKKITTDLFAESNFRLRESGRGDGIETYNLMQGTDNAAAVDFTDEDNFWNNVNVAQDEIATDGHFGAEMTYDYFKLMHGRNSIDDAGFKLISYVHYDVNYANAFWDGQEMTYGDGDNTYSPFTAMDICGHEITHGLTEFTANLTYAYESGALNEGYSDIFGVMVEFYGDTLSSDWLMGEDIGQVIRSMSNPGQYQNPDTYQGNNWATGGGDNGGVHTNSGVIDYWFYLASQGGNGTNDNNDVYSVAAMGRDKAAAVSYRTLTAYLIADAQYEDARFYSIQSAKELYGDCSPEVQTVTNAFYAVGVGNAFTPGVSCDFNTGMVTFCTLPAAVQFSNSTSNGSTYHWDFGDGTTSTQVAPSHLYTTEGTYSVTLISDGGACGSDTLTKVDFIAIDAPETPVVTSASNCGGAASLTLTAIAADSVRWYTGPMGGLPFFTGTTYTTPVLTQTQKYYVSNQIVAPSVFGAKTNKSTNGNYYTNSASHFEIFDVIAPVRIKSVKVYANSAGMRNVEVRNSAGVGLVSTNINIPAGESRITLNFDVPVGTDYQLAGPFNPDLWRDKSGCTYPYTIPNLLSITGSSATQAPTSYFYYFYDWEVEPQSCSSQRVMVAAYINYEDPAPAFTTTLSGNGLIAHFTNTTTEGNTFLWNFGDGESSTLENPVHTYADFGSYTVSLDVSNACGAGSVSHPLNIVLNVPETDAIHGLQLSPNPAESYFEASYNVAGSGMCSMQILDLLGKVVWSQDLTQVAGNQKLIVPVEFLNSGIYTVVITSAQGKIAQKLVKR